MSSIADIRLAPEGEKKINWVARNMPILNAIRDELQKSFGFDYEPFTPDAGFMAEAEKLAAAKYATAEWNENGVYPA